MASPSLQQVNEFLMRQNVVLQMRVDELENKLAAHAERDRKRKYQETTAAQEEIVADKATEGDTPTTTTVPTAAQGAAPSKRIRPCAHGYTRHLTPGTGLGTGKPSEFVCVADAPVHEKKAHPMEWMFSGVAAAASAAARASSSVGAEQSPTASAQQHVQVRPCPSGYTRQLVPGTGPGTDKPAKYNCVEGCEKKEAAPPLQMRTPRFVPAVLAPSAGTAAVPHPDVPHVASNAETPSPSTQEATTVHVEEAQWKQFLEGVSALVDAQLDVAKSCPPHVLALQKALRACQRAKLETATRALNIVDEALANN